MTQLLDAPAGSDNGNQLARRYEPRAPVGSPQGLKGLLEASKSSIMQALPKHVTPERLIKTMLVAANRTPKLFDCTQSSVLETINRAAELGLDLSGTLGEAYPVPYGNTCTLIIGYRGLEKLAWQSGEIASIDAEVVRERDTFIFKKGTEVTVEWTPCLKGDPGEAIGAYACVTMKGGGKLARFLPVDEIEKIRKVSRSGSSGPWKDWWGEMARKTALRRVLKDAPLSTEKFVSAMDHDGSADFGSDVLEAQTQQLRGAAALAGRLANRQQQNDPATHPDGSLITAPVIPQDESEADRILREKSPSAQQADITEANESQVIDERDVDAQPPAEPTGEPHPADDRFPKTLPAEARKGPAWIDNAVMLKKPEGMSANAARKAFHAQSVASWPNLAPAKQDALYDSLVAGDTKWK